MFELIGKGEKWHIMELDAQLGSVPVATVRNIPEELTRARYLIDAANRDEERLVKQGVQVVRGTLDRKREGAD